MERKQPFLLSIVIPTYNSIAFIEQTLTMLVRTLDTLECSKEIILVNDGSTDSTVAVTKHWFNQQEHEGNTQFVIVENDANYGQLIATINGLKASRGTYIVIFDDDLQYFPEDILRLLHTIERNYELEMVGGYPERIQHRRSIWIDMVSGLGKFLLATIFFPTFSKVKYFTSFKIFRRKALFDDDGSFKNKNIYFFWDFNPHQIDSIAVQHQHSKRTKNNYNFLGFIHTFHHVLGKVVQNICKVFFVILLMKALVFMFISKVGIVTMVLLFAMTWIIQLYLNRYKVNMMVKTFKITYL